MEAKVTTAKIASCKNWTTWQHLSMSALLLFVAIGLEFASLSILYKETGSWELYLDIGNLSVGCLTAIPFSASTLFVILSLLPKGPASKWREWALIAAMVACFILVVYDSWRYLPTACFRSAPMFPLLTATTYCLVTERIGDSSNLLALIIAFYLAICAAAAIILIGDLYDVGLALFMLLSAIAPVAASFLPPKKSSVYLAAIAATGILVALVADAVLQGGTAQKSISSMIMVLSGSMPLENVASNNQLFHVINALGPGGGALFVATAAGSVLALHMACSITENAPMTSRTSIILRTIDFSYFCNIAFMLGSNLLNLETYSGCLAPSSLAILGSVVIMVLRFWAYIPAENGQASSAAPAKSSENKHTETDSLQSPELTA